MRQRSTAAKIGIVDLRRVPTYNTMDRLTTFADEDRKSLNENEISVSRYEILCILLVSRWKKRSE